MQALGPAWSSAQRGDLVFVTSDVRARAAARDGRRTSPPSGVSRVSSHALQMELEGTGVAGVDRSSRPDADRDGLGLGPDALTDVLAVWEQWGLARHPLLHARRPTSPHAIVAVVGCTARRRTSPLVEVEPVAPLRPQEPNHHEEAHDRRLAVRSPPAVSGGEDEHGHLEELRPTRSV